MSKQQVLRSIMALVLLLTILSGGLGVIIAAPTTSIASEAAPTASRMPAGAIADRSGPGDGSAPTSASSPGVSLLGKRPIVVLPQNQPLGAGELQVGQVRFADPGAPPKSAAQLTPVAQIQPGETNVAAGSPPNPYYSVRTVTLSDGTELEEMTINGPPQPPPGYERERAPVAPSALNRLGVASTLSVPAYDWVFGCSAVSASMIGAYFDRNGLSNIYTGPTNGGVMPMDNGVWPRWTDSTGHAYPGNPLVASRNGSDGRTSRGSIDDYWVASDSTAQDPYITGGWSQHAWSDAFGDYMKTSQSAYGNVDGATGFYTYASSATQLTCAAMESAGIASKDGSYGRKLFYEARGYTVKDCYNQKTDNNSGGFTYANYKALIDAGYPVLLNLEGHSIVGVGYADPSTVYIHDTWDYETHQMTWGGSYSGMRLLSVSVVNPVGAITPTQTPITTPGVTSTPDPGGTLMSEGFEGAWPAAGWQLLGTSAAGNDAYLLGKRNCHPHTGSYAGWTIGGGPQGSALSCGATYPNDVSTLAVYGPFDLSSATSASLSFYVWGKSQPPSGGYCYDYLYWGSAATSDFSDWDGVGTCGDATAGSAGNGYYKVTLDLAGRLGASQVWVTIGFASDESVNDIGYVVDDVALTVGGSGPAPTPTPMGPTPTPMGPTPTATRTPMSPTATPTATRTPLGSYSIAGRATVGGSGLAGVTVSDGAGHSATTDASGAYTLSGLAAGSYTVTAAKSGCTFTPGSRAVSVPPSASGQDFTGSCGAGGTRVKVLPANLSANLSSTFSVTLNVEGVTDLAAYEAKITYNPAIVQVTAVNQGPFLSSTGRTVMPVATVIDNVAGRVEFGAASLGANAYPSGGGVLATITLQAKAVGVTALHVENALLSDPSFQAISVSLEDGQVRVTNCFGDFNGDGKVNIIDLQMAAARWNCRSGQACYDAQYDVIPEGAPDGAIDIRDIQRIAAAWNTTCGTGQAPAPGAKVVWPEQVAAASLGLQPAGVQIAAGRVFSQTIRLQDVSNLGAFQADVVFDPAVVQVEAVTLGAFLGSTGRAVLAPPAAIDNVAGRVRWGAGSFGPQAGASGSGDVATIRFRAVGAGETALAFEQVLLVDAQSSPLELGSVAGSRVTVGGSVPKRILLPLILKNR